VWCEIRYGDLKLPSINGVHYWYANGEGRRRSEWEGTHIWLRIKLYKEYDAKEPVEAYLRSIPGCVRTRRYRHFCVDALVVRSSEL
jgi:hypothetical protein